MGGEGRYGIQGNKHGQSGLKKITPKQRGSAGFPDGMLRVYLRKGGRKLPTREEGPFLTWGLEQWSVLIEEADSHFRRGGVS